MKTFRALLFVFVVVLLSACQTAEPTQTQFQLPPTSEPTQVPTDTITPTDTTEPTSTPIPPTATAMPPTATIEAPAVLARYLSDLKITSINRFDDLTGWFTNNSKSGVLVDGTFELTGQKDWSSGLSQTTQIGEGQGIILKFKFSTATEFEVIYEYGDRQTDAYRRFGISAGTAKPEAILTLGKNPLGFNVLPGNFIPQADTWYNCFMGVGKNGTFLGLIWNPADPTKVIMHKELLGQNWAGLTWQFTVKVADVGMNVYVDDAENVTFGQFK
ncbi:MAG: hypothetical protein P4L50_28925 [Anaerolineaceae bacterium]|nr:hypothetical protein [Anaerolineaceae bacterium]